MGIPALNRIGHGTVAPDVSESTPLERVRDICTALPEVTERLSHGSPAWFIREKKTFVMYLDDHHYVGHRGWVGVHLNRGLDWNEIAGAIEEAYLAVAPKRHGQLE